MPKVFLRASGGQKPLTFELKDGSGNIVATRANSNKDEEAFDYNGWGYQWKITDATGAFKSGGVDAVTHQLLQKPIRMKAIYFYTGAVEASTTITETQAIPGFNTASVSIHSYQIFGTGEKYNHARWGQVYDHTVPNQSFTAEQDLNSLDRLVYNAYSTGTNLQNRIQLRIMFAGSLRIDEISQNWGYQIEDLPVRPDGSLADRRPSLTYQVRFPSYASDRALSFFKECLKKFCFRYQKAINDGTIREIGVVMNESGESNQSGGYFDDEGNYTRSLGDYNVKTQQKFIDFCKARYGTIQVMNQKLGSNIKSFTLNDGGSFGRNMLAYGADGGNDKVRGLWHWYQMELHALFEHGMQKYVYDNVPLTRSRLWCFDVGSIYNGDMFRMKSMNFRQRLYKNPTQWMTVKSNNSFEGSSKTPDYVTDQILTAAGTVGAQGCWEPSPWFGVFTVNNMSNLAVAYCINKGVGLSAFSANPSELPVGDRYPAVEFWTRVSNQTSLASHATTFKANDLDANGNRIIASIPYFSTALNGFDDSTGDYFVFQAWEAVHDANPGKVVSIFVDDSDVRDTFVNPYPITGESQGGGGGEIGITEIQPLSNVSLASAPTYSLPAGAMNMTAEAVSFAIQADYVNRGMVNFIHPTRLWWEKGGEYHAQYNPGGITVAQLKTELDAFNFPTSVGIYRMMYDNAVSSFWPRGQALPSSQQALNEAVEGYAIGLRNALGWQNHPMVLDVDFEDGQFFTWGATKAQADAIAYTLSRNTGVRIQAYASGHNNLSGAGDGSAENPTGHITTAERFRLFKEAGVTVFQGTLPYFHMPSYFWNDPSHEPSVIGDGKMYASQADYALKSIHPIVAKLGWTDGYFNTIPAGHQPPNLEWAMGIYEGGDDGGQRYYDNEGNWISGLNWPAVGNWLLESLAVWGIVTGSFRWGGGIFNWSDGRPRKPGQDHMEAGKWRAYQYNRFNNSATQYNIKLEHSLDGGNTWQTDDRPGQNLLQEHTNPKPYIRGAFYNGELLVVAVAGQPFHVNGQSQQVLIRYGGKQFSKTLQSQKVHSFTVSI